MPVLFTKLMRLRGTKTAGKGTRFFALQFLEMLIFLAFLQELFAYFQTVKFGSPAFHYEKQLIISKYRNWFTYIASDLLHFSPSFSQKPFF